MFSDVVGWLSDSSGLTAHGFCLLWEPGLIWTYAISDTGIALAYFSIPLALVVIARKRRDLVFRPLLWLFALFIVLCGVTHWLDVLTLWIPAYRLEGFIKAATALVSIFTAISLWVLLPKVLTLPSPAQMREANAALMASNEQLFQAQKMDAVGRLTGGIAHDFNNIVQSITSGLTLIERRISQGRVEEATQYIAPLRKASESAASLTNRLLAFSRRQALQPRSVEPDTLVAGMEQLLRRSLDPSIRLEFRLGDGRWNAVCDPNLLESTLLNLAINARDAMPEGGTLIVSTADRSLAKGEFGDDELAPGDYVEISVADSGVGMSPEVLARAFEPFFTTKPIGQGTGLGLSQVYGFVRQSGGVVRLESVVGRGTTVRLYLPGHDRKTKPVAVEPARAPESPGAPAPEGSRGKVLLVEDREDVRTQIADILKEMGCVVVEAADGASGLQALHANESLALVITDIGLPGLNGRQLADAAHALNPRLPVLLITGYAGQALDSWELAKGAEILRKPFSPEELTARVNALLAKA